MRNSAFPANSARIQIRPLSVRAASDRSALQRLNSSIFDYQLSTADHGSRGIYPERSRGASHCPQLLLTSNSFSAITYVTVCKYSFHRTLSLAPATLTRYPLPNSFPCHSYATRGGGGVWQRARNLLKTNDRPSELARFERASASLRPFSRSTLEPLIGVVPS
jgi:hypothetical protein